MDMSKPLPYFTVERFSHHFVVKDMSPMGQAAAEAFARNYIQFGMIKVGRFFKRGPLKVFAAKVAKDNEIRFHIGQWPAWKMFLSNRGVPEACYVEKVYGFEVAAPLNATLKEGWVAHDYQVPIIEYLQDSSPAPRKLVEIQPGKGKASNIDSLIKIPGGWKRMGDINVGDAVITQDGSTTTVIGVFPQGEKQLYKVTFADGRSTEVDAEHLWKFHYKNTTKKRRWRVGTTMDMLRCLGLSCPQVSIPLIESEKCENLELPIEPYLLGVILGDGSISGNTITVTKPDKELFDNISPLLGEGLKLVQADVITQRISRTEGETKNRLTVKLEKLKLMGKRSWEKFIPPVYLRASTEQRLKLLQGLMDTDGTANTLHTGGAISYNSTSRRLASDVQYLVRSLGGIASISVRNTKYTHNGELKDGRTSYDINIRYKRPSELFTLPRKKEKTNDDNQYAGSLKLRVVSIEPSRVAQAQCIAVDHESRLYVTDDFIVTHNTFCASSAIASMGRRMVAFLKPKYLEKWGRDLKSILDIDREDIEIIQGSGSLMKVIAKAMDGSLDCKAILISNRTFQHYINNYEKEGKAILDQGYDCLPHEFIQATGCGVKLVDEVHEDFHLNFKIDLYTHVPWAISLSATLVSDDPFITRMHEIAYAPEIRYNGLEYDKYVDSHAFKYRINGGESIRVNEVGSTNYSHMAFEKSICKNPSLLRDYLRLIDERMQIHYLTRKKAPQRCLIYAASIQMCTYISEYLKAQHPSLDVRRYVEDDPYDNLMQADICVSTIGSSGTGHDIPHLITVLLTVAIASKASNIQGFGRLRKIADTDVVFEYFTCLDVPKHVEYYERKEVLLAGMAKNIYSETLRQPIG